MADEKSDEVSPRKQNALKKLANSNFARFAIQVQHVSEQVQMRIIEQLPEFNKLAGEAIERISKAHQSTLKSSQYNNDQAHEGFKTLRDSLVGLLEDPQLTLDDKLRITAQIAESVTNQTRFIAEANRAQAALFMRAVVGVVGVAGMIVIAIAGGRMALDASEGDT